LYLFIKENVDQSIAKLDATFVTIIIITIIIIVAGVAWGGVKMNPTIVK